MHISVCNESQIKCAALFLGNKEYSQNISYKIKLGQRINNLVNVFTNSAATIIYLYLYSQSDQQQSPCVCKLLILINQSLASSAGLDASLPVQINVFNHQDDTTSPHFCFLM